MRVSWIVAVTALALAAAALPAEEKKGPPTVQGTVKAVDVKAGTLTLAGQTKEGQTAPPDETFTLAREVRLVIIDNRPVKLADLKPGTPVVLELSADRKSVVSITHNAPRLIGFEAYILGVDAKAGTITVGYPAAPTAGSQTVKVPDDARITVDGNPAKLGDLKAGVRVRVKVAIDSKAIVEIAVGKQ
jgi:hypothetical protein